MSAESDTGEMTVVVTVISGDLVRKTKVRDDSAPTLSAVAADLKKAADLTVSVGGHTDNVGADAANLQLSERRAKAVVAKLAALGVPAGRLQAKGYGASQPVASNDSPEGRQRNCRVELVRVN